MCFLQRQIAKGIFATVIILSSHTYTLVPVTAPEDCQPLHRHRRQPLHSAAQEVQVVERVGEVLHDRSGYDNYGRSDYSGMVQERDYMYISF